MSSWGVARGAAGRWLVALALLICAILSGLGDAHAQTGDDAWLAAQPRASSQSSSQSSSRPSSAQASTTAQRGSRVVREVLALYDSTQEAAPDRTRIHRYLELPLNHLGLTVTYWDLAAGLPDAELVKRQRGIITWFGERLADPGAYLDWAARTAAQGTRFVVLEFVGSTLKPDELPKVNAFMNRLGLEVMPRWVGTAEAGSIVTRDAGMTDFEAKLEAELPGYMVMEPRSTGPGGGSFRSHVVLESKASRVAPQVRSSVIVTGPAGGFAAFGYVRRVDPRTGRLSWLINPFLFLTAALALEQAPIPDTTTVAGRRMYFAQVDGEGWHSPAAVGATTAADVVRKQLIAPYPDLPVSVGLIAADADPAFGAGEATVESARRMFALPQVEAASHTYTLPLRWTDLESYDRERELARIFVRRASMLRSGEQSGSVLARFAARDYAMQSERAFQAAGNDMPRALMQRPFNLDMEVAGALSAVRALVPADKPTPQLYLWSGDNRPFEAAIRATRAAGARNLNGGDPRFDTEFPSIMYLAPTGRPVGRERQFYAVNSNDISDTNGGRGPFDGQARLSATWDNTETPQRLKPMHLAYHMYAATRPDSLGVVRQLLEKVRASRVAPVSAAHYAAIADAFYEVEISRMAPMKWRVANRGALQTVRFDDAANLYVDMRQAQGVLGFTHHGKSLYVALDDAVPEAVVALTSARPEPRRQERPYLVDSRWQVSRLKVAACGFEAEVRGYGAGEMTWAGVRPGGYTVSLASERSEVEIATEAMVDQGGEFKVTLNGRDIASPAITGGRLKVACARVSPLRTGTISR